MAPPRNERQRPSRRRSFEDDFAEPIPLPNFPDFGASKSTPEITATVKWYNSEKGFGFVELSDGSGDAFLHANVLQAAGLQAANPGATMQVQVGRGQKGRQVERVLTVDESTAAAPAPRQEGLRERPRHSGGHREPVDLSASVEMTGVVKWYNADKGFGFISPEDGGRDVFVHATALERANVAPLKEGQAVRMQVVQGAKGPEVGMLRPA
jgi:CspA family cold shock protein